MSRIIKRLAVIIGLIFIAWTLILAFSVEMLFHSFYGWVCFCGNILAFVLAMASLLLWEPDNGRDTTEINALPLVFSGAYFIVSLLVNTAFLLLADAGGPKIIPLAINGLLVIAFISGRIFILPYRDRVLDTAARTAKRTQNIVGLSAKLSDIMALAQDKEISQRLRKLKEQLDYSTNTTQFFTADAEAQFSNQLSEIADAIAQKKPAEEILNKIDQAEIIWKRRNGSSSMR